MHRKTYKYKLDFYYQQALIYLSTLVLYAGVRGSFIEEQFSFVFKDPIIYITAFFICISVVALFLNILRGRKLVITDENLIFHSRNRERVCAIKDIEWMHIGKERLVQTAGHFQLISIKMKQRPIPLRIRVGRYEHSHDLIVEMEKIGESVPKKKLRRFNIGRRGVQSKFFQKEA